jgi:hypothetical protein
VKSSQPISNCPRKSEIPSCRAAGSRFSRIVWLGQRSGVAEILNLQPRPDGTAKPYQVKQVRNLITKYKLSGDSDAE